MEEVLKSYKIDDGKGFLGDAMVALRADGADSLAICFLTNFSGSRLSRDIGAKDLHMDVDGNNLNIKIAKGNETPVSIRWSGENAVFDFKNNAQALWVGFREDFLEPDQNFRGIRSAVPYPDISKNLKHKNVHWYYFAFNDNRQILNFFDKLGGK